MGKQTAQKAGGVKRRFPDSEELPSATLQLPLTLHIIFVPISPVPVVTITLDGQSRLSTLNHEVDPFTSDFIL